MESAAMASEWVKMSVDTDKGRENCKSWFAPLCDDMEPIEAQMLVDIETDRTKKLKVLMREPDGSETTVIRSWLANNRFSIEFKRR